jgi:hypothetical protein
MATQNCWEFKKCGREPGGARSTDLGICAAAVETRTHGMNSGTNGGRTCWVVSGTLCGGEVQGALAMKLVNCMQCDFYKLVMKEEGLKSEKTTNILARLSGSTTRR